jgi:hypothetical protein
MVIFGIQHYMYVDFVITLIPDWIAGRRFWAYFTGTALLSAGVAISLNRIARPATVLLGAMIFGFFVLVHVPLVLGRPNEPDQITYLTQAFTFSGIAFLSTTVVRLGAWPPGSFVDRVVAIGRWQIAIGFVVLGIRQLLQMPFVHRLVPDWYPGLVSWSTLAALLLLVTGLAVAIKRERGPALALAGLLLVFLLSYHLPWLALDPYNRDWGAACKDSILCAGALLLALNGRRTKTWVRRPELQLAHHRATSWIYSRDVRSRRPRARRTGRALAAPAAQISLLPSADRGRRRRSVVDR